MNIRRANRHITVSNQQDTVTILNVVEIREHWPRSYENNWFPKDVHRFSLEPVSILKGKQIMAIGREFKLEFTEKGIHVAMQCVTERMEKNEWTGVVKG